MALSRPATSVLAVLLCGAACGGQDHPPVRSGASIGLSVELQQYREDQLPRVVQVGVTARDGITVLRAQVRAAGFAVLSPTVREDPVPAGQLTDVPVPYGEADCATAVGPATVLLTVRLPSGKPQDVSLAATDPENVLGRVHADDCRVRAVTDQVRFSLADDWRAGTPADPVRRGALHLERVSGHARIAVTELQRNTLFAVTAPALAVLEPDAHAVDQPLEVRPIARCNIHALAESKRATIFGVYVTVGAADPVLVTVASPAALRVDLLEFAGAGCSAP